MFHQKGVCFRKHNILEYLSCYFLGREFYDISPNDNGASWGIIFSEPPWEYPRLFSSIYFLVREKSVDFSTLVSRSEFPLTENFCLRDFLLFSHHLSVASGAAAWLTYPLLRVSLFSFLHSPHTSKSHPLVYTLFFFLFHPYLFQHRFETTVALIALYELRVPLKVAAMTKRKRKELKKKQKVKKKWEYKNGMRREKLSGFNQGSLLRI